jgi:hypothetical protein
MGLWKWIVDSWRQGRLRDEEAEKNAAIDKLLRERDHLYREQSRDPRLPPRGDRG